MKTITKFIIVAGCVGSVGAALLRAQAPPPEHQRDQDHTRWVKSCLRDFESIKVGMTRGQVEAKLPMDGGLHTVSPVRFVHPACRYFKIDVEFEFKRNAADQGRAIEDAADKVTKVSKPYIERPFFD
jgi:hypothetical protein